MRGGDCGKKQMVVPWQWRRSGTRSPGTYDAILMDIQMPEMDGYEAARTIRSDSRPDAKSIPIIAMTANAFEQDVNAALEAGMDAHLSKPIEPERLFQTLHHHMGRKNKV